MRIGIRQVREELKMSQEELSERSNISKETIDGLESGSIQMITVGTILQLSEALGKKVQDIFLL